MLLVIGQGYEGVVGVHGAFVKTSHGPLTRTFKAATNATPTRNQQRLAISSRTREYNFLRLLYAPGIYGMIADHRAIAGSRPEGFCQDDFCDWFLRRSLKRAALTICASFLSGKPFSSPWFGRLVSVSIVNNKECDYARPFGLRCFRRSRYRIRCRVWYRVRLRPWFWGLHKPQFDHFGIVPSSGHEFQELHRIVYESGSYI